MESYPRLPGRLRQWPLALWSALPEFRVLAVLSLVAAAIWGFAELAEEVLEGETHAFDQALLLGLRNPADPSDPLGPLWLEELLRDFTSLGGYGVLVFLVLAAAGFLVLQRQINAALFLVLAIGGGQLLTSLLKMGFDRPRPDLVPH
jgi:undecaprenyl-diphosphatase